jgi:hypothetical protein
MPNFQQLAGGDLPRKMMQLDLAIPFGIRAYSAGSLAGHQTSDQSGDNTGGHHTIIIINRPFF